MEAVILSVGDELTMGQTTDTNSAWLSARLAEKGVMTRYHLTVPDDVKAIMRALASATAEAALVIVTGGLGPTEDDLTREALSRFLGVPLEFDKPSLERIEALFKSRGRAMPESNRIQALCPRGATMLENPAGTAPGIKAVIRNTTIHCFPGVPSEMRAMFERHAAPGLPGLSGRVILTLKINTFGLGESAVGETLGPLMRRDRNPKVGTTATGGIVSVRIRSEFETAEKAQAELDRIRKDVESSLGDAVFGHDQETLQEALARLLKARHKTVATAESCTGGLLARYLTDVPGSSEYYWGGWVTYANRAKESELQVPAGLIREHGAVSEPVVQSMAGQALKKSGADYALALSGVAGPDGGTPDKPVGTVWIAMAARRGDAIETVAEHGIMFGDRAMIRDRAAKTALNRLRLELLREP
ncbi:MAG: competence/damage-inducible protein A [Lentisphaerae bacterium]|nr:competence/damage-inducible protein A [Lentisphaerota bacterium]